MTTDLEKQFFDTFGIPQLCCKEYITNCLKYGECEKCKNYDSTFSTYPQITDRILLELICILNDYTGIDVRAIKIEELKKELLNHCIELIEYELYNDDDITKFKHQVRTLFEEKSND